MVKNRKLVQFVSKVDRTGKTSGELHINYEGSPEQKLKAARNTLSAALRVISDWKIPWSELLTTEARNELIQSMTGGSSASPSSASPATTPR
ncbi:MAG TPA: hypothetical protein VGN72_05075 [Tepidisphaeraceae bacterium]|nr:hypothetical protein [Tepidisphaeraceae bacterium]